MAVRLASGLRLARFSLFDQAASSLTAWLGLAWLAATLRVLRSIRSNKRPTSTRRPPIFCSTRLVLQVLRMVRERVSPAPAQRTRGTTSPTMVKITLWSWWELVMIRCYRLATQGISPSTPRPSTTFPHPSWTRILGQAMQKLSATLPRRQMNHASFMRGYAGPTMRWRGLRAPLQLASGKEREMAT